MRSDPMRINFCVNGAPVELTIPPDRPLSHLLRYDLGLTGTKIGCDEGRCGSCTVLVNGRAVRSCVFPARRAQGATILTIEGLAQGDQLHPLQEAFVRHGAVQCGFCTPGLLLTAKALLDRNPHPTEQQIRRGLRNNLCRCTGYRSIVAAVLDVARNVKSDPELPLAETRRRGFTIIGQSYPAADAVAKVTGVARYADDLTFPGMLFGATLRAGVPHAHIRSIDTSCAKALPGVHAVLTHENVPGAKNHGLLIPDWPVLCYDKVRYVGDAVALVAAETPETVQQALALIKIEYEPLPVVTDPRLARRADAPLIHETWPTGNLLQHIEVRKGNAEKGFVEAAVVIERTYDTPIVEHLFMEPECAIGRPTEDGRIEVYVGSQIPYDDRRQIAASLNLSAERVRVIGTIIGGAFGGKEDITCQIHAALLAQATGRPVKILYSRSESLLTHPKGHATVMRLKVGAHRDGRLTALEADIVGDTGAYASVGDRVMARAAIHVSGPYDIPNVQVNCYAVYTNNPPAGAWRGFGVPQACFAVESTLDELAHALDIDACELRRINALQVGSTTATGQVLHESVGLSQCLAQVREHVSSQKPELLETDSPTRKRAWGFALAYKNTGLGGGAPDKAEAELELYPDGHAEVRSSAAEMGQGLPAVLRAVVAQELELHPTQVHVLLSDTDLTPDGGPTTASRQTHISGNAARYAAQGIRQLLATVVSERIDIAPEALTFRAGTILAGGLTVTIGQAAAWAREEGREPRLRYDYRAPETRPLGQGGDMHFAYSFAAHAALVEVNTETGKVSVLRVVAAHDVGRALNPLALQGQVEGGIVMGMGLALSEAFVVDNGLPYTDRLSRYKIPTSLDAPKIVSYIVEEELSSGPYGAKGVGELSTIPVIPAITNAIYNAVGVRVTRLPVNARTLAKALRTGAKEM